MSALAAEGLDGFVALISDGPLLVAMVVAAIAGTVSFLSPCVLPLVPGYLSYVTGLSGAELGRELLPTDRTREGGGGVAVQERTAVRLRVLTGSVLFVLGFSAVFVSQGLLFGGLGALLIEHQVVVDRILGAVTIVMGLAFMRVLPGFNRELRIHRLPNVGLAGAPLLGIGFGVGWTPCLGPTLAAVQTLAYTQASAGRGALLTLGYCLGLGLPFILTGLAFRRALDLFAVVKRHYDVVMYVGGLLLVAVGVLLLTGVWQSLMIQIRVWVGGYSTVL